MRSSFSGVASVVAGASALAAAAHASVASAFAVGTACSKEALSAGFVSSNSCTSVSYVFRLFVIAMRAWLNAARTFTTVAAVSPRPCSTDARCP